MQTDVVDIPVNVKRALQAFAFGLVAVLSFDNALFHLFSLLLVITFGVSLRWNGLLRLKAAFNAVKWVHLSFAAIWAIMLVSNLVNSQSAEAWRTMAQFVPRYWLLFLVFSFLLFFRLVTVKQIFIGVVLGLSLQFIPFLPSMVDLSIFDTRFQGMNRSPNTAGFQAVSLVLLSLYLAFYQKMLPRIRHPLAIALGSMALIALLASGNRGSWVAGFVTITVFLFAMLPRYPKEVSVFVLIGGLIAIPTLIHISGPAERFALLLEGNSTYRLEIWKTALNLFIEKPLFGYGLDLREQLLVRGYIYQEHNIFISVLTAMGIAGLLAYLAMLGNVIRLALKYQNYFALLMIGMMLMVGMFAYDFYRSQIYVAHFVILAAIATHYRNVEQG